MTAQSDWDSAFSALVKAGAHVRTYKDSTKVLYIHAKAVVADAGNSDEQMFVGSENFSVASLRRQQGTRHPHDKQAGDLGGRRRARRRLRGRHALQVWRLAVTRCPRQPQLLMRGNKPYSVYMRAIRAVSAIAAGALVAAVAACTGSTTDRHREGGRERCRDVGGERAGAPPPRPSRPLPGPS